VDHRSGPEELTSLGFGRREMSNLSISRDAKSRSAKRRSGPSDHRGSWTVDLT
jgi:hypothetical protein